MAKPTSKISSTPTTAKRNNAGDTTAERGRNEARQHASATANTNGPTPRPRNDALRGHQPSNWHPTPKVKK